jgi:UDP-N-acetylglucosamine 2-epimerase (non-hydrolysing)
MGKTYKLLLVAGARPNFMKIAPLISAIKKHNNSIGSNNPSNPTNPINPVLVHTGQHYDLKMSEVFFKELGIPHPDINLEVGSGSHAEQTARVMTAFEPVCQKEKPDWVVVVGDVNSTMACTLVACKLGVKVAHIEAGLRSFDRTMPEEINRLVTDALADLLLTPSIDADENLKREGICGAKIKLVGNIMIDTLVANLEKAHASRLPEQLELSPKNFAYVTLHRPANVDLRENLSIIIEELNLLSRKIDIIFPVHPRTRKMIKQFGIRIENGSSFQLLEPVGYHDSLWLTENAALVLTDSGGLQEESTYLQTPCLTLRPNTERPVTIDLGTNKLTGLDRLRVDIQETLESQGAPAKIPPFWDGHTAERIIDVLIEKA